MYEQLATVTRQIPTAEGIRDAGNQLITIANQLSDVINKLNEEPQYQALYQPLEVINAAAPKEEFGWDNLTDLVSPGTVGAGCQTHGDCRDGNRCDVTQKPSMCLSPIVGTPCYGKEQRCDRDLACDAKGICRHWEDVL